jgi:hypothetical protein
MVKRTTAASRHSSHWDMGLWHDAPSCFRASRNCCLTKCPKDTIFGYLDWHSRSKYLGPSLPNVEELIVNVKVLQHAVRRAVRAARYRWCKCHWRFPNIQLLELPFLSLGWTNNGISRVTDRGHWNHCGIYAVFTRLILYHMTESSTSFGMESVTTRVC